MRVSRFFLATPTLSSSDSCFTVQIFQCLLYDMSEGEGISLGRGDSAQKAGGQLNGDILTVVFRPEPKSLKATLIESLRACS